MFKESNMHSCVVHNIYLYNMCSLMLTITLCLYSPTLHELRIQYTNIEDI